MATQKKAAIPPDVDLDTPLTQLSAAAFIDMLGKEKLLPELKYWPEKKKVELEVDPLLDRIRVRDFVQIIKDFRGEKKKVEYEIPDWWRWRVNPDPTQMEIGPQLDRVVERLDSVISRLEARL
jgi:hypothetical protein